MKKYTEFVKRTYTTIAELNERYHGSIHAVFAEGPNKKSYSQNQEYAILQNEYANVFVTVIQNHLDLLGISDTEYQVKSSKFYLNEVKIEHSCYPKNIRRWLSGTISRKKKCRIEFCVLVWCHAIGWSLLQEEQDEKLNQCQQKLKMICMDYVSENGILSEAMSFELLWKASTFAYYNSFQ